MLHDTAVVTLAIRDGRAQTRENWDPHPFEYDEASKLLIHSAPTHLYYARKIQADYVQLVDRLHPDCHVFYEKLQMGKLLDLNGYRRIFYIDADVVIRGDTSNVFDLVPEGKLGVFNETPVAGPGVTQLKINELMGFVGGPPKHWTWNGIYFCAGVMVMDRSHGPLLRQTPSGAMLHLRHGDQGWLNLRAQLEGIPIHTLPEDLHFMPIMHPGSLIPEIAMENQIIHVAAYPLAARAEMMRQIVEIWKPTYK